MYKCIIKGEEVNIDSEQVLEEMLVSGILNGNEQATNVENGKVGLIKQTKWFKEIIKRKPSILKPSRTHKIIGILCLVLGGILLLIAAYLETLGGGTAVEVAGTITGIILGALLFPGIIYGVVHAIKKRKPSILLFSILFLLISASSLEVSYESVVKRNEQYENFKDKIIEMQQKSVSLEALEPYSFDEDTYGRYSELGDITQKYYIAYGQLNREFVSDLQLVTADKVLSPSVLQHQSKIQNEIAKIEKFEDQFKVYKEDIKVLEADYLSKLDTLSEQNSTAKRFKTGYLKGLKTNQEKTAKVFEKTSEMVLTMKETLKFMEAREGQYVVDGELVFFNNDSDVKLYNDFILKLNQIGEEVTKLNSEI